MSEIKKADLRPAFVWLHQKKNKTFKEIADIFGVTRQMVSNAVKRFNETNSNKNRKGSGRQKTATSNANIQVVANLIAQNPSTKVNSARKLARRLRTSRRSIQRILTRELELFPYKLKDRQELGPEHIRKRLNLCKAMKER